MRISARFLVVGLLAAASFGALPSISMTPASAAVIESAQAADLSVLTRPEALNELADLGQTLAAKADVATTALEHHSPTPASAILFGVALLLLGLALRSGLLRDDIEPPAPPATKA